MVIHYQAPHADRLAFESLNERPATNATDSTPEEDELEAPSPRCVFEHHSIVTASATNEDVVHIALERGYAPDMLSKGAEGDNVGIEVAPASILRSLLRDAGDTD